MNFSIAPLRMIFGLINVVQAQSYTRDVMKYVGGVLAARGVFIDGALWEAIVGVAIAAVGTLWSQLAARQKSVVALAGTIVSIEPSAQRAAGVPAAAVTTPDPGRNL